MTPRYFLKNKKILKIFLKIYFQNKYSSLLSFLNSDFSLPENEQTDIERIKLKEKVRATFWQEFQIKTKFEDDFVLFKYDQAICKSWDFPFVSDCRGIIVRLLKQKKNSQSWEIVSRPFTKFFNQNESKCKYQEEKDFNPLCEQFYFLEKVDGTCIQFWYDYEISQWKFSTLGKVTPDDWVIRLISIHFPKENYIHLKPGFTYLFELCCKENKIVTEYETDRIYLISVRNIESSQYLKEEELKKLASVLNVWKPKVIPFKENDITSLKLARNWVEVESSKTIYGTVK